MQGEPAVLLWLDPSRLLLWGLQVGYPVLANTDERHSWALTRDDALQPADGVLRSLPLLLE